MSALQGPLNTILYRLFRILTFTVYSVGKSKFQYFHCDSHKRNNYSSREGNPDESIQKIGSVRGEIKIIRWTFDICKSFLLSAYNNHDDVIKWKHFPRYWPFVRGIYRSNSPHKDQWRRALVFSFICVWINFWVNNRDFGDLRRHRAHYGVTLMITPHILIPCPT